MSGTEYLHDELELAFGYGKVKEQFWDLTQFDHPAKKKGTKGIPCLFTEVSGQRQPSHSVNVWLAEASRIVTQTYFGKLAKNHPSKANVALGEKFGNAWSGISCLAPQQFSYIGPIWQHRWMEILRRTRQIV